MPVTAPRRETATSTPVGPTRLVVQHGDTLERIAQRHSTTVAALSAVNPQIHDRDHLFPDEVLEIPDP